jgi:hypothetical protein
VTTTNEEHMKNRKLIASAATVAVLALVTVGCSKDKAADTTGAAAETTAAMAAETTAAAAAETTAAMAAETTAAMGNPGSVCWLLCRR